MYDADPYGAQRSVEPDGDEAPGEARRPRVRSGSVPAGGLVRRALGRLALVLVSLGGRLVRHALPPYDPRPGRPAA